VDLSETSHANHPEIKTYKLAEQTGRYTPNPTREEYGSNRSNNKEYINARCR
jgi:hypothetical protein